MNIRRSTFRYLIPLLALFTIVGVTACETNTNSATEKLFESSNIAPGGTFSYTFEAVGTVEYYCRIHAPNMQGIVTVTEGAEISGQDTVEMNNNQFNPSQITVAPNTEIVWINEGTEAHTVVSGNPPTVGNGGY